MYACIIPFCLLQLNQKQITRVKVVLETMYGKNEEKYWSRYKRAKKTEKNLQKGTFPRIQFSYCKSNT